MFTVTVSAEVLKFGEKNPFHCHISVNTCVWNNMFVYVDSCVTEPAVSTVVSQLMLPAPMDDVVMYPLVR